MKKYDLTEMTHDELVNVEGGIWGGPINPLLLGYILGKIVEKIREIQAE
jgi:hypothetical protein